MTNLYSIVFHIIDPQVKNLYEKIKFSSCISAIKPLRCWVNQCRVRNFKWKYIHIIYIAIHIFTYYLADPFEKNTSGTDIFYIRNRYFIFEYMIRLNKFLFSKSYENVHSFLGFITDISTLVYSCASKNTFALLNAKKILTYLLRKVRFSLK